MTKQPKPDWSALDWKKTDSMLGRELGMTPQKLQYHRRVLGIAKAVHRWGEDIPHKRRNLKRDAAIVAQRLMGATYRAIAEAHGITHQRVEQIVRKHRP